MTWTVERVDDLARFWSQGFSARQIAEKLGGLNGFEAHSIADE